MNQYKDKFVALLEELCRNAPMLGAHVKKPGFTGLFRDSCALLLRMENHCFTITGSTNRR